MKNMKGITLIALVITIVVLIILAGVAINLSLGENGIFNKAKFASEEYANEQAREELEIGKMTNEIETHVGSSRETVIIPKEEYEALVKKGTWELLATHSSTTQEIVTYTVPDLKKYSQVALVVYNNGGTTVVDSSIVSYEIFKEKGVLFGNMYNTTPFTGSATYYSDTSIGLKCFNSNTKPLEFYGIY